MKKIINDPKNVVNEFLNGLTYAYSDLVKRVDGKDVIVAKNLVKGRVGLVSGGGSGHEPSHAGFVGDGMLSAAVSGAVFTSPTPDQVLEGIKAANTGAGVLLIVKNYTGDIINFEMAKDLAEAEGIDVEYVVVNDDIAVEGSTWTEGRRGVAGTVLVHKLVGALARQGLPLLAVKARAEKIIANIKTIGLALSGATVPEVGKPGFVLAEDEFEYGVGIHGEPGYKREKLVPSYQLAEELVTKLKKEFGFKKGDAYGVLVNGLGATPLIELFVFINDVKGLLDKEGIKVEFKKVGNYMTAIDMAGLSLTLIKLENDDLKLLNEEVNVIAW